MTPWKSFTFVMSRIQWKFEIQGQDQFCGNYLYIYFHQIEFIYNNHEQTFLSFHPIHIVYLIRMWVLFLSKKNIPFVKNFALEIPLRTQLIVCPISTSVFHQLFSIRDEVKTFVFLEFDDLGFPSSVMHHVRKRYKFLYQPESRSSFSFV